MDRKLLMTGLALGFTAMAGGQSAQAQEPARQQDTAQNGKRPNVVFILADDLGYGDVGCYGQERFDTPNIDSLAAQGMRFTRCYSGTTVSAPSRACLLTGLHSGHAPVRGNIETPPEGQYPLPEMENIFLAFKEKGYKTGAFGKWGLGAPGTTGDPARQGIDEFFGYNCQLLAHNYYPDHLWENDRKIILEDNADGGFGTYSQDLINEKALEFIDRNADRPFFLFLPYVLPHAELLVPKDSILAKFSGMYPETPYKGCDSGPAFRKGGYCSQPEPRATFAAMVYRLDMYVGQVVAKLRENGLLGNTLIIFASDNGPHKEGGADPDFFDSNGIFRGYKRDLYEGGIRVPFIAAWEGVIEPDSESGHVMAFWDLSPTFRQLLSETAGDTRNDTEAGTESSRQSGTAVSRTDGISILPVLTGRGHQEEHDWLYFEFQEEGGKQAVISGNMKLIRLKASSGEDSVWELYDLENDPSETVNLLLPDNEKTKGKEAAGYRRIAKNLRSIMKREHVPDPAWPLLEGEF